MSVHPEVCEAAVIALDVTAYIILGTGSSCKQVGHEPRNGYLLFRHLQQAGPAGKV